MKTKILTFTVNGCGGSERATLNISRILHNKSCDVKNYILDLYPNNDLDPFIPNEIPSEKIKIKKIYNSFFKLHKVIKKEQPDYVFTSTFLVFVIMTILTILNKKIKVIVRHGFMPNARLDSIPLLFKIFYPYAYKIIAQTDQMKDSMIDFYGLNKNLITVINNPIDEVYINKNKDDESPFKKNNHINYVAVGRIGPFKDYDTLINAFEIVNKENINTHLYILGIEYEKVYSTQIKNSVIEKGLNQNVHFEGFTNNPYKYLFNSDCFVLSSITEGLPNVMLEAMYLKIPVVATRCIPFVEENIIEGKNGYCVDIKDYVSMADAMKKAIGLKGKISECSYSSNNEGLFEIFN